MVRPVAGPYSARRKSQSRDYESRVVLASAIIADCQLDWFAFIHIFRLVPAANPKAARSENSI